MHHLILGSSFKILKLLFLPFTQSLSLYWHESYEFSKKLWPSKNMFSFQSKYQKTLKALILKYCFEGSNARL